MDKIHNSWRKVRQRLKKWKNKLIQIIAHEGQGKLVADSEATEKRLDNEVQHPHLPTNKEAPQFDRLSSGHDQLEVSHPVGGLPENARAEKEEGGDANRTSPGNETADGTADYDTLKEQIKSLESQLAASIQEVDRLTVELDANRKFNNEEVETMKQFLSAYDGSSEMDISKALKNINDLTERFARQMSHRWPAKTDLQVSNGVSMPETTSPRAEQLLREILHPSYIEALRKSSIGQPNAQLLLQYAWQACICHVASEALGRFYAGFLAQDGSIHSNDVLVALAKHIRDNEVQSSYGRWKAMTHQYLRKMTSNQQRKESMYSLAAKSISLCATVAGILSKTVLDEDKFTKAFLPEVLDIIAKVLDFAETLQENVITREYLILEARIGEAFDPARMVAEEGDELGSVDDKGVCTTRLGLQFSTRPQWDRGAQNATVTVFEKAEVLTFTSVKELEEMNEDTGDEEAETASG